MRRGYANQKEIQPETWLERQPPTRRGNSVKIPTSRKSGEKWGTHAQI